VTSHTARYLYHCRPVSLRSHAGLALIPNNQIHHQVDRSTKTIRQGTIADHSRRRLIVFVRRVIARMY
jgi:hypothetical protein